jgi:lipopolysaccharide export system permease protein
MGVVSRKLEGMKETLKMDTNQHVNFNFMPNDLSRDKYTKDKLTTPELERFIRLEELRGSEGINDLKIERYRRDATCITVLLLTLIGAIVAGKKVRGGSGFHLARGVFISVMYILVSRLTTVFATKGNFTPWLAAWLPNMIFGVLAIYFYKKAPK